ncbi:MAG: fumarate reductase subunit D [Dehalococcoidia bacterium]|nr:fumarate reductase subunit D [Dehalococcoidia bacterium]
MRPSNEPLFWSLFSAGGMAAALLAPVLIVLTGLVVPGEAIEFERLADLFGNVLVRLVLLGFAFVTFFHWAHRFRHTLYDLGLSGLAVPVAVASYSAAALGTVWAAMVTFG